MAVYRIGHQAHGHLLAETALQEIVELVPGQLLRQRLAGQALHQCAEVFDVVLQVLHDAAGVVVGIEQFILVLAVKERQQRLAGRAHIALAGLVAGVVQLGEGLGEGLASAGQLEHRLQVDRVLVVLQPAVLLQRAQQVQRIGALRLGIDPQHARQSALAVGRQRDHAQADLQHQVLAQRLRVVGLRAVHALVQAAQDSRAGLAVCPGQRAEEMFGSALEEDGRCGHVCPLHFSCGLPDRPASGRACSDYRGQDIQAPRVRPASDPETTRRCPRRVIGTCR